MLCVPLLPDFFIFELLSVHVCLREKKQLLLLLTKNIHNNKYK